MKKYGKQSGNAESLGLFVFECLQGTGDEKLFCFTGNQNFSFCHYKTTRHKKEGNKNEQFGNHSDRNGSVGSGLCLLRKMACKKVGNR